MNTIRIKELNKLHLEFNNKTQRSIFLEYSIKCDKKSENNHKIKEAFEVKKETIFNKDVDICFSDFSYNCHISVSLKDTENQAYMSFSKKFEKDWTNNFPSIKTENSKLTNYECETNYNKTDSTAFFYLKAYVSKDSSSSTQASNESSILAEPKDNDAPLPLPIETKTSNSTEDYSEFFSQSEEDILIQEKI